MNICDDIFETVLALNKPNNSEADSDYNLNLKEVNWAHYLSISTNEKLVLLEKLGNFDLVKSGNKIALLKYDTQNVHLIAVTNTKITKSSGLRVTNCIMTRFDSVYTPTGIADHVMFKQILASTNVLITDFHKGGSDGRFWSSRINTAFELGHFVYSLDREKNEIFHATDPKHFNAHIHSMEIKYSDPQKLRLIIADRLIDNI